MIDEKAIREAVIFSLKKIKETIEPPANPATSEKVKQSVTSRKIDTAGVRKKSSSKKEGEVEEEDSEEETDIRNKFDKDDKDRSRELKNKEDDKFSYDIPKTFPKNVAFNDVLKQLNFLRSGASAKDTDVKKGLMQYFENLKDSEKRDLLSMLSGFATIMNKAGDASDAPTPSSVTKKIKKSEDKGSEVKQEPAKSSGLSPIVVGEVAKKDKERKIMAENNQ